MLSFCGLLNEYKSYIQKLRQCILICTLTQTRSEPGTILERNLAKNGWREVDHSHQTVWMAQKWPDEFMCRDYLGRLAFGSYKIKKTFFSYFAGVGANYRVEADFVLFIGNAGKCTIKYNKPRYLPAQIHYHPF